MCDVPSFFQSEHHLQSMIEFLEGYKLGVGLFVIKPDLVANGKQEEILHHVNKKKYS